HLTITCFSSLCVHPLSRPLSSPPSSFFFSLIRPPPRSPLFPYTTLFRSLRRHLLAGRGLHQRGPAQEDGALILDDDRLVAHRGRSEEHTSELQSLTNLVCRLLLEKKKNNDRCTSTNKIDTKHTRPQHLSSPQPTSTNPAQDGQAHIKQSTR